MSFDIMIVTEYNGHTQGFLVEGVDTILRLDWSSMRVPPDMLQMEMGGLVTAVTELENGKLIMMMDVEKVLAETSPRFEEEMQFGGIKGVGTEGKAVFFADDSLIARKQIERTLQQMGMKTQYAVNGRRAWEELQKLAADAEAKGVELKTMLHLILTDIEMPEMDGYMLTKSIKSDGRFAGIPVLMHSSLSGASNQQLGTSVGVDGYVTKFEPLKLSEAVSRILADGSFQMGQYHR
jgi:two-component system chemotaxis response regulator CheV